MLSKQCDFEEIQIECNQKWSKLLLYAFDVNDKDIFSIDTPPPTISGSLHIGHVFSYAHVDYIARYQRMRGKNVFYPCGFDNNGLPTERLIEKQYKIKASTTNKKEFLDLCNETSKEKIKEFRDLFDKIGFSFDHSLTYETNSSRCKIASQKSFLNLYKRGLIYKKLTPMFWDVIDQTAIAQAEIEEKEFESCMNYIDFQLQDDKKNDKNNKKITIATTRPELLSACVAILFNPQDERYKNLNKRYAITPLFNNKVPILPDEDVLPEKGTGLVMCCTFGDEMDVKWWQRYNLPVINAIDKYGRLSAFDNKKVQDARDLAISMLKDNLHLVKQEKITHNVKCAERSGAKLEIIPTMQWYIKILEYKEQILEKAKQINWLPNKMRIKIEQWIEGIKWDWCISRQRYLGVSIPVWYDKNTQKEILPDYEDLPIDPQIDLPKNANKSDIIADNDVLDTWATSAITPQINCQLMMQNNLDAQFQTMTLRPQAHEIIRTWAFYTILRSYLEYDQIPWSNIVISGWCLAHDKTK